MRAYAMTLLAALLLATACRKPGTPTAQKTRLQLVTQAPWKETLNEYRRSDGSWVSVPLSATVQGYLNAFTATGPYGGTYAVTSGGVPVGTGTWQIIGDDTQMALNGSVTYDFGTLDDNTMQLVLNGQIAYTDPTSHATTQYYGQRQTFVH